MSYARVADSPVHEKVAYRDELGGTDVDEDDLPAYATAPDPPRVVDTLIDRLRSRRRLLLIGLALGATLALGWLGSALREDAYTETPELVGELRGEGKLWAVLTTINEPTDAVKTLAAMPELNVVVVGDTKTPADWHWPGVHFLSIDRQRGLGFKLVRKLKVRHYARKVR